MHPRHPARPHRHGEDLRVRGPLPPPPAHPDLAPHPADLVRSRPLRGEVDEGGDRQGVRQGGAGQGVHKLLLQALYHNAAVSRGFQQPRHGPDHRPKGARDRGGLQEAGRADDYGGVEGGGHAHGAVWPHGAARGTEPVGGARQPGRHQGHSGHQLQEGRPGEGRAVVYTGSSGLSDLKTFKCARYNTTFQEAADRRPSYSQEW